jgi:hypothetical protein
VIRTVCGDACTLLADFKDSDVKIGGPSGSNAGAIPVAGAGAVRSVPDMAIVLAE